MNQPLLFRMPHDGLIEQTTSTYPFHKRAKTRCHRSACASISSQGTRINIALWNWKGCEWKLMHGRFCFHVVLKMSHHIHKLICQDLHVPWCAPVLVCQVTKHNIATSNWQGWNWKSFHDHFENGAFFRQSGASDTMPFARPYFFPSINASAVPVATSRAGPLV